MQVYREFLNAESPNVESEIIILNSWHYRSVYDQRTQILFPLMIGLNLTRENVKDHLPPVRFTNISCLKYCNLPNLSNLKMITVTV